MYPRRGPPKSTPTNVLCQKCLKRGHYSYECKVAPQDRPYKARPSRSQQLRNPKLAPKLHEETFNAVELKKGVADEELAKREAERAKKRRHSRSVSMGSSGSESDADRRRKKGKESGSRRRRSPSYSSSGPASDSRSPSPAAPRRTQSPGADGSKPAAAASALRGRGRSASADSRSVSYSRSRSASSYSSSGASRSPSPPPTRRVSPPPRERERPARPHDDRMKSSDFFGKEGGSKRSSGDRRRNRDGSRSPVREREERRPYRQRDENSRGGDHSDRRERTSRDRSLSPFSQRLALTKEMKSGK